MLYTPLKISPLVFGIQVCVKECGSSGLLYASLWVALLSASVDACNEVASTARKIVNRLMWRLVQSANCSSSKQSFAGSPSEVLLAMWRKTPGPTPDALGLISPFYAQCVARFSQPTLGAQSSSSLLDPLCITGLERAARKRAMYNSLLEATALSAAAYDDVTLKAVLEASAGIGDALRGTALQLSSMHGDKVNALARIVLAAARGRALLMQQQLPLLLLQAAHSRLYLLA